MVRGSGRERGRNVTPTQKFAKRWSWRRIRSVRDCEGRIRDVAYTHIEHKLPKRKYPNLVCTWENLTIACPRCNTNKGDYDIPECPLLDPYVDGVEAEVAFFGPLALPRGGARAGATITRIKLNRMDLLFARGEAITSLDRLLDLVRACAR